MSKKDLPVIVYKILAYIYECMKAEAQANVSEARRLCACNNVMFGTAVEEIVANGYAKGIEIEHYYDGPEVSFSDARLTLSGSDFLLNNSTMHKAKEVAGTVFQVALSQVTQAATKVATGM